MKNMSTKTIKILLYLVYNILIYISIIYYHILGALSQTRFSVAPKLTVWHHLDESAHGANSESVDVKKQSVSSTI